MGIVCQIIFMEYKDYEIKKLKGVTMKNAESIGFLAEALHTTQ